MGAAAGLDAYGEPGYAMTIVGTADASTSWTTLSYTWTQALADIGMSGASASSGGSASVGASGSANAVLDHQLLGADRGDRAGERRRKRSRRAVRAARVGRIVWIPVRVGARRQAGDEERPALLRMRPGPRVHASGDRALHLLCAGAESGWHAPQAGAALVLDRLISCAQPVKYCATAVASPRAIDR